MSKTAEEATRRIHNRAILEAEKYSNSHGGSIIEEVAYGRGFKAGFIEGYEQAWKDIKEWIEEQATILDKQTLLHPDDDMFWVQRNLFKEMKDKLNSL